MLLPENDNRMLQGDELNLWRLRTPNGATKPVPSRSFTGMVVVENPQLFCMLQQAQ